MAPSIDLQLKADPDVQRTARLRRDASSGSRAQFPRPRRVESPHDFRAIFHRRLNSLAQSDRPVTHPSTAGAGSEARRRATSPPRARPPVDVGRRRERPTLKRSELAASVAQAHARNTWDASGYRPRSGTRRHGDVAEREPQALPLHAGERDVQEMRRRAGAAPFSPRARRSRAALPKPVAQRARAAGFALADRPARRPCPCR